MEILTQRPLSEMQANEERQGNLLQAYEQRFEKLSEDQKLSSKLDNSSMPFRRQEEKQITLCAENIRCLEIKKGTRIKGWIQSNVRFGPFFDIKVCNHTRRYSIDVQVQSLFQDQTVSWIRIVNGIDKFVREAIPIQEEAKDSGKPAAKARPILKSSSISDVNFIPIGREKWMDIETQESNDPCFSCGQKVHREGDGAVHSDQVIDECKKKQFDNTEHWSMEMKKDFINAPHLVDCKMDISSGKRWRTKEKVSILLESELSSSFPLPFSSSRTFRR